MEFRILRKPGRDIEQDERPLAFGKRQPFRPQERRASKRHMFETATLVVGVAALAYLVVDVL